MNSFFVPSTADEWAGAFAKTLGQNTDVSISYFGAKAFDSASKVDYADWLRLRVYWTMNDKQVNHGTIFGQKANTRLGDSTHRARMETWWRALQVDAKKPWDWGHMAAWRQTVDDLEAVRIRTPQWKSQYHHEDPFRLVAAPGTSQLMLRRSERLRHQQRHQQYVQDQASRDLRYQDSTRTKTPDGSPGASTRGSFERSEASREDPSPPHSKRSSPSSGHGTGGQLSQGDTITSAGFGGEIDARNIMRNRPDEALVNMSLVLLLQGVSIALRKEPQYESYNWTTLHKQFSVTQPDAEGNRVSVMTAKTDGCLQFSGDSPEPVTLSILEVKPFRRWTRPSSGKAVQVQEGAEMAAWISTESTQGLLPSSGGVYRRLMVSQDFDEVYITIAEYDDLYVRHIRGDPSVWPQRRPVADSPSLGHTTKEHRTPSPVDLNMPRSTSGSPPTGSSSGRLSSRPSDGSRPLPIRGSPPGRLSSQPSDGSRPLPIRKAESSHRPEARGVTTGVPKTPSPPGRSALVPGAPKPSRDPLPTTGATNGFLVMREYPSFRLTNKLEVEALTLLLISLTKELCDHHREIHLSSMRKPQSGRR